MWEYSFLTNKKETVDKIEKFVNLLGVKGTSVISKKRTSFKYKKKEKVLHEYVTNFTKLLELYVDIVAKELNISAAYISVKTQERRFIRARYVFIYVLRQQFPTLNRGIISNFLNKFRSVENEAMKNISTQLEPKFAHIPENQKLKLSIENIEKTASESKEVQRLIKKIKDEGVTIKQKRLNSKRVGSTNTEQ